MYPLARPWPLLRGHALLLARHGGSARWWARAEGNGWGPARGAEGRKALLRRSRPARRRSRSAHELCKQGYTWQTKTAEEKHDHLRTRPCPRTAGLQDRVEGVNVTSRIAPGRGSTGRHTNKAHNKPVDWNKCGPALHNGAPRVAMDTTRPCQLPQGTIGEKPVQHCTLSNADCPTSTSKEHSRPSAPERQHTNLARRLPRAPTGQNTGRTLLSTRTNCSPALVRRTDTTQTHTNDEWKGRGLRASRSERHTPRATARQAPREAALGASAPRDETMVQPSVALPAHFPHTRFSSHAPNWSRTLMYRSPSGQARKRPCLAGPGLATINAAKGSALTAGQLTPRSAPPP